MMKARKRAAHEHGENGHDNQPDNKRRRDKSGINRGNQFQLASISAFQLLKRTFFASREFEQEGLHQRMIEDRL